MTTAVWLRSEEVEGEGFNIASSLAEENAMAMPVARPQLAMFVKIGLGVVSCSEIQHAGLPLRSVPALGESSAVRRCAQVFQ
jgi:hypothetical protein